MREKVRRAFVTRGANGNKNDNSKIIEEIVALRAEQAKLLGHPSYADYKLPTSTAGNSSRRPRPTRGGGPAAAPRPKAIATALQEIIATYVLNIIQLISTTSGLHEVGT